MQTEPVATGFRPKLGSRVRHLWPPQIATRALVTEVVSGTGLPLAEVDRLTPCRDQFFASGGRFSTKRLQRCARGEAALGMRAECYFQGQRLLLLDALDRIAPGCKVRYMHLVWRALEPRQILCVDELAQMARELGTSDAAKLAVAIEERDISTLISWFENCPVNFGRSVAHAQFALMLIARRGKIAASHSSTRREQDLLQCAASEFAVLLNLPDPDRAAVIDCVTMCGAFDGKFRRDTPRFLRL